MDEIRNRVRSRAEILAEEVRKRLESRPRPDLLAQPRKAPTVERLSPPLEAVMLDEIAGRLDEVNKTMLTVGETMLLVLEELQSTASEGVIDPNPKLAVTETISHISPKKPWFSVDFFNHGPDLVYVALNDMSRNWSQVPINRGKTFNIGRAKINIVYYRCDKGQTATLDVEGQL